jgi:hypothetical protein
VRALRLFKFGLSATMSHLGLAFAVCVLFGGISGALGALVYSMEDAIQLWVGPGQIKGMLTLLGIDIVLQVLATILIGPIFQAAAAFAAFRHSRGKPGSTSLGINFALSRYKRMFGPHARTWVRILIGIQLFLLPGIIFWNQLGLVDAVSAFEKSKDPLRRSRQLTKGYRRTIFLLAFPWFLYAFVALLFVPELLAISVLLMVPHQMVVSLYLFIIFAAYGRLFLERTGQHESVSADEAAVPEPT